jgi:hypothetical protein
MTPTRNASRLLLSGTSLLAVAFALLIFVAIAPVNTFAQGTYTQTYLPSAYGTYAFVGNTVIVGQTAPTSLTGLSNLAGNCGTADYPLTASSSAAGVNVLGLISGGAVNTSVSDNAQQAQAQSNTASISLLGGLISAQAINAISTTTMDNNGNFQVSAAGSNFNHLVVLGHVYNGNVPANTRINLPLLGYVVLNEQSSNMSSSNATMTVNMIHVYITVGNLLGLQVGTQVVVSNATSGMYNEAGPGIIAGDSYGTQVIGSLLASSPTAPEVLPCAGTANNVVTNTQVGLNLPTILTTGTLVDTVQSEEAPTFDSGENTSTITGLNLLSGLVTASVMRGQVDAYVDQDRNITLNGQDSLLGISVAGHPEITDDVPANTAIPLAGLGTLYLKRIIYFYYPNYGVETRSVELVVNQINIYGLPLGLDVIVGDAMITASLPYVPPS